MATYLLTWNPDRADSTRWGDALGKLSEKVKQKGKMPGRWSTGTRKTVHPGDKLFLVKQGKAPRGIMASGLARGECYQGEHWENKGALANYVVLTWDALLDPDSYPLLPIEKLTAVPLRGFNWAIRASGIVIDDEQAKAIEEGWAKHLIDIGYRERSRRALEAKRDGMSLPKEIDPRSVVEGAKVQVTVNRYERNPRARQSCIDHWGCECAVCRFSFKKKYGLGDDYIHVHHLIPLTTVGRQYEVDPINDLRPVCPNCHAMLHLGGQMLTIPQLKAKLKRG